MLAAVDVKWSEQGRAHNTQEAYAKRSFPCLYTVNLSDILPRFRISLQNSFQPKLDMPRSCWKTNKEELRPTRSEMIEWVKLNHFTDSKEQTAEKLWRVSQKIILQID